MSQKQPAESLPPVVLQGGLLNGQISREVVFLFVTYTREARLHFFFFPLLNPATAIFWISCFIWKMPLQSTETASEQTSLTFSLSQWRWWPGNIIKLHLALPKAQHWQAVKFHHLAVWKQYPISQNRVPAANLHSGKWKAFNTQIYDLENHKLIGIFIYIIR